MAVAVAGLSACDADFLDLTDPDTFDVTKYYKSAQDLEDALTAAYEATRTFYNQMYYVTEMKSDNATTTNVGDSGGLYSTFVTHQVNSNNTIVINLWNGLYNCIYKSNLVLAHADEVRMDGKRREALKAEAKFLRALSHFYLVRLFGPVPVVEKVVETTGEAKAAKRQPESEVYASIKRDLEDVALCEELSPVFTGDSLGRASRTAGAALLGKVYVTEAAALGHPEYYGEAVKWLEKACELTGMDVLPTAYPSVFGVNNENNEELIFQCMYLSNPTEYSTFASDFQPYGQVGLLSQKTGRGCNLGEENLYNEFESGDRRKATCITRTADGSNYYTKKYTDLSTSTGMGGNNWIELRFADVFLLLAEAHERLNHVSEAVHYLDLVRTRHGALKGYEESCLTKPEYLQKYPTLRDAIFHERRVELCFENQRWFDLRRLYPNANQLAAYMNSVGTGLKYSGFKSYESLLPIPYDENLFNSNLYQNEGY